MGFLFLRSTDLDVVRVGRLEFFSEVRVSFQHLNHLSEVAVIVQTGVLRYACTARTREHVNTERMINA